MFTLKLLKSKAPCYILFGKRKMTTDERLKTQSAQRKQSQFCAFATHKSEKKVRCKEVAAVKQRRRNFMKNNMQLVGCTQSTQFGQSFKAHLPHTVARQELHLSVFL